MNTQETKRSVIPNSPAVAAALNIGRKALAIALAYLMVPLGIGDVYAQTAPPPPPDQGQYQGQAPPPQDQGQYQDQSGQYGQDQNGNYNQGPPPQAYNALAPEQLDQLVAPIALYPDALVAQVLAASTYPTEVADADNFLRANQDLPPNELGDMANQMNWDPSVKSLVAFPSVLYNLDRNMDWTSQLGNAYYNQPQDVMDAVQNMRARAYAAGNLRSSSQLEVEYQPGDIIIAPANPNIVYVPWYNPWVVYGAPIAAWGGYYAPPRPVGYYVAAGIAFGFGVGIVIGAWSHWGWGYHQWGMGWRDRTVVYQRNIYISRSEHVVNHGYYGRFDRRPDARRHNMQIQRRAPVFHRVDNRRPGNFDRQPQQNRNRQFNRPQQANRPQQNRPQNFTRRPQQNRNQFNQPKQTPRQFNRPQQANRPQQTPRQFNRPQNRPQPRPQARPQQRPQAAPKASRPEKQAHPKKEDKGHRR
ncbi:MAG TPA: DUF3300 domain-containing protein [Acidobacteriaceae bacterium]|nr:DUF3300 domain-containing protein [Acidobacteriaceae bacterium]